MEQTAGVVIKHARNGREYRLTELPHISVDGYCAESNTILSSLGAIGMAAHVNHFVTSSPRTEKKMAARNEQTIVRLEQITRVGNQVKVQWECLFDNAGIVTPELLAHPTVCKSPLFTRDTLYGGLNEAVRLHYRAREGVTIQYVFVTSQYPFICKYGKFPVGHPVVHVGDACKDKEACLGKESLIKCTIVPPERLYHTVLPFRAIRNSCSVFAEHVS